MGGHAGKREKAGVKLYNSMKKMESVVSQGIPFKISHGKSHAVVSSYRPSTGQLVEVKLTIPKVAAGGGAGAVNTTLHENMHLIDLYLREDLAGHGHFRGSQAAKVLDEALAKVKPDIGEKAGLLFKEYKEECYRIREAAKASCMQKVEELTKQYYGDGSPNVWADIKKYKQYEKERKKLYSIMEDEVDTMCRDAMGGGVGQLQDVYDALSG